MEELNKNQIVLLTLLVSFVTSIATGIVTVTLMDQAPAGVTQTVNRVVERTIEKVVPGEVMERTVIKEVPVVVTEEELIVKVINEASPAVVKISSQDGVALGSGFLASDDGFVVSVAHIFGSDLSEGRSYRVSLRGGESLKARLIKFSPADDIVVMRIDSAELQQLKEKLVAAVAATSTPKQDWKFLTLQDADAAPGQTVVSLGSPDDGPINVSVGIVSSAASAVDKQTIRTSAANSYNIGGPILNIKGKVIGLSQEPGLAISTATIKKFISSISS